jgi:hypothetical protein
LLRVNDNWAERQIAADAAAPRVVTPSAEPLEESPKCVETDGAKLLNDGHHIQR